MLLDFLWHSERTPMNGGQSNITTKIQFVSTLEMVPTARNECTLLYLRVDGDSQIIINSLQQEFYDEKRLYPCKLGPCPPCKQHSNIKNPYPKVNSIIFIKLGLEQQTNMEEEQFTALWSDHINEHVKVEIYSLLHGNGI